MLHHTLLGPDGDSTRQQVRCQWPQWKHGLPYPFFLLKKRRCWRVEMGLLEKSQKWDCSKCDHPKQPSTYVLEKIYKNDRILTVEMEMGYRAAVISMSVCGWNPLQVNPIRLLGLGRLSLTLCLPDHTLLSLSLSPQLSSANTTCHRLISDVLGEAHQSMLLMCFCASEILGPLLFCNLCSNCCVLSLCVTELTAK